MSAKDLAEKRGKALAVAEDASSLTHKQAVRRIANWLRCTHVSRFRSSIVVAELVTLNRETPDVLAFRPGGASLLIEVKVFRSDFLADKKKSFRRREEQGMGNYRYYAAPKGLLVAEEMPEGWGLIEIAERHVTEIKGADWKEADKGAEVCVLMSAIRRLEISTAVFVREEVSEEESCHE